MAHLTRRKNRWTSAAIPGERARPLSGRQRLPRSPHTLALLWLWTLQPRRELQEIGCVHVLIQVEVKQHAHTG